VGDVSGAGRGGRSVINTKKRDKGKVGPRGGLEVESDKKAPNAYLPMSDQGKEEREVLRNRVRWGLEETNLKK